tara:strand:- start:1362 stop:1733 length:372 start_codon:yes stop_codon:yes gene_type:complete
MEELSLHEKKLYIFKNIEKSHNQNIFIELLDKNSCKYTKNNNGVFLNLNTLSDTLINDFYNILFFNNDDTIILNYEKEKSVDKPIKKSMTKEDKITKDDTLYLLKNYPKDKHKLILFSKKYNL